MRTRPISNGMRFNLKSTNLDASQSLNEYIETKLGKLEKLLKRMEQSQEFLINVEVARTTKHHKKGDIYRAEANLDIGKNVIRAESESSDIHIAINEVCRELEREVIKFKEKLQPKRQKVR